VLTKKKAFGDDGLYLEMTPVGGVPSAQMSPDDCSGIMQLGSTFPESKVESNQTDLLLQQKQTT